MTTLDITPLDNLLPMQLEDARIVLQYWLAQGQFHDDDLVTCYSSDVGFFYDQRLVFSEHDYYLHVRDRMVLYVNNVEAYDETFDMINMSNMDFVNEVGMWAVAMTTLNRALPVTLEDAYDRDMIFFEFVQHGYDCISTEEPMPVVLTVRDLARANLCYPVYEVRRDNEVWRNGHPFFEVRADQMDCETEQDFVGALVELLNNNRHFW